uniref:tRNA pseudouridine(55) synthase n=1 Tax=Paulinella micropora TaxID=1928728 RepID=A0A1L5YCP0_9EUKA|nr:putative tRNA pseudouridine 55 synthase [Paulinella micropora]
MMNLVMPCGFLIINKVAGCSSHQCVDRIRQVYKLKRVGHGGTLDPDATGVLTVGIGPATRLLPYLPQKKSYTGEIQLGQVTTTDDLRGEIISNATVPQLNVYEIQKVLSKFIGVIQQQPPQISAVHVNGERSYIRARRGENVITPTKVIRIYGLDLKHWEQHTGRLRINISCSSGTYIRSLARDIGKALGCGGCLSWLQRTEAQGFHLDHAVFLDTLTKGILPKLVTPTQALQHLSPYDLTEDEYRAWKSGRTFPFLVQHAKINHVYRRSQDNDMKFYLDLMIIAPNDEMAGIAFMKDDIVHPKIVLSPGK